MLGWGDIGLLQLENSFSSTVSSSQLLKLALFPHGQLPISWVGAVEGHALTSLSPTQVHDPHAVHGCFGFLF